MRPEDFLEKPHAMSSIKKVIGVVSGKGGVGKSLVTSLMAVEMNRRGAHTAILDADVTGPSIPKAFGLHQRAMGSELGLLPVKTKSGIDVMSVNLLLDDECAPVVWRGPIIANTVKQFWTEVIWSDVDYMFVDMPPGTGDVQMSLCQLAPLSGAIIVSTPQDLALNVALKAVDLFQTLKTPIAGFIENMSYFQCPHCGQRQELFGSHGAQNAAQELGVPCLGNIPLEVSIRQAGDKGTPVVLADPESASAQAFEKSAQALAARIAQLDCQEG